MHETTSSDSSIAGLDEFTPELAALFSNTFADDTIGVLQHEGFHQYIYYCLLKHNPPVWFNEGFAEYFYTAKPAGRRVVFEDSHPKRYGTIKSALGPARPGRLERMGPQLIQVPF